MNVSFLRESNLVTSLLAAGIFRRACADCPTMMADEQNLAIFAPLKRSRSELEAYEPSSTQQCDRLGDNNENNGAKRSRNGSEGKREAIFQSGAIAPKIQDGGQGAMAVSCQNDARR